MQREKLSSKNDRYTYCDSSLRIFLLQRSCVRFFLYQLQSSSEACWIISSKNSILETVHTWKTNKIITYWNESAVDLFRLDSWFNFYQFYQNLTSIRINFTMPVWTQSVYLKILSYSVMIPYKFTFCFSFFHINFYI